MAFLGWGLIGLEVRSCLRGPPVRYQYCDNFSRPVITRKYEICIDASDGCARATRLRFFSSWESKSNRTARINRSSFHLRKRHESIIRSLELRHRLLALRTHAPVLAPN